MSESKDTFSDPGYDQGYQDGLERREMELRIARANCAGWEEAYRKLVDLKAEALRDLITPPAIVLPKAELVADVRRQAIEETLAIYTKAFEENWVVQDTIDAIRALLDPATETTEGPKR